MLTSWYQGVFASVILA